LHSFLLSHALQRDNQRYCYDNKYNMKRI
jgi:hypothetical protein